MNEPITSTVGPLSGQKPYPRGPLPVPLLTVDERSEFWDQVSYEQNGCQLWTGDVLGNGAGCYYLRDAAYQAHRVAYQNRVTL
ncbi:hypothetical protein A2J03_13110 [Rhodococcus sp. EPR-157]|uniref:hypothetical protein n=1 Tax=Rhodococcus sp. EPR-157 TaxID=1813677 RepID=UPI0007BBC6C4|nr:hypothetical protein [Rhodococcus sp. EPR-157]KZE98907.1 hypothetical protein A2J03_13110 [Rhodococcus sp. EPR-157]